MNSPIYRQYIVPLGIMCNICNWKAVDEYDLELIFLSFVHSTANFLLKELYIVVGIQGAIYYDLLPRIFHALEYSVRLGYISGQICSKTEIKGLELQLFFSPAPTKIQALQLELSKQRTRLMENFVNRGRWKAPGFVKPCYMVILLHGTSRPWEDSPKVVQAQNHWRQEGIWEEEARDGKLPKHPHSGCTGGPDSPWLLPPSSWTTLLLCCCAQISSWSNEGGSFEVKLCLIMTWGRICGWDQKY